MLGMGGQVVMGGFPGMQMMQQMPGVQSPFGVIGVPRFRWQAPDLLGIQGEQRQPALDLQVHLARAAAANHQQLGQLQSANPLAGPAANLLAHPLLGVSQASQMPGPGPGVFLLPRLP